MLFRAEQRFWKPPKDVRTRRIEAGSGFGSADDCTTQNNTTMLYQKKNDKVIGDIDKFFDIYNKGKEEVFPAFMVEMPKLTKDAYTYEEFIAMVKANPDLAAVRVHKQRFGYMVNDTVCEVGNVLINGAKVVTINSESTEIEDIKKTMKDLGLGSGEHQLSSGHQACDRND